MIGFTGFERGWWRVENGSKEEIHLPLGKDSFEKLQKENCYYIDKTGIIEELVSQRFEVSLITRPRRFGKTLMMSMLEDFFDIEKEAGKILRGLRSPKMRGCVQSG